MVELQIVVLVVAGSSPVGHPPPSRGRGTTAWQARLRKSQVPESNLQTGGLVLGFWNLRFEISASGGVARPVLKIQRMSNPIDLFGQSELRVATPAFWKRILNDEQLRECDNLEKLLAGCEIIAVLDGRDLLAA